MDPIIEKNQRLQGREETEQGPRLSKFYLGSGYHQ